MFISSLAAGLKLLLRSAKTSYYMDSGCRYIKRSLWVSRTWFHFSHFVWNKSYGKLFWNRSVGRNLLRTSICAKRFYASGSVGCGVSRRRVATAAATRVLFFLLTQCIIHLATNLLIHLRAALPVVLAIAVVAIIRIVNKVTLSLKNRFYDSGKLYIFIPRHLLFCARVCANYFGGLLWRWIRTFCEKGPTKEDRCKGELERNKKTRGCHDVQEGEVKEWSVRTICSSSILGACAIPWRIKLFVYYND